MTKPGCHGNASSPLPWPTVLQLQILTAAQDLHRPTNKATLNLTICRVMLLKMLGSYLCLLYPHKGHVIVPHKTNSQTHCLLDALKAERFRVYLQKTCASTSYKKAYLAICRMSYTCDIQYIYFIHLRIWESVSICSYLLLGQWALLFCYLLQTCYWSYFCVSVAPVVLLLFLLTTSLISLIWLCWWQREDNIHTGSSAQW